MSDSAKHTFDVASAKWRGRAIDGASFCAIVPGAAGGGGTTAHFLPIALALAAFTAAGVWMFHRWGGSEPAQVPERVPEPAPRPGALRPDAGA